MLNPVDLYHTFDDSVVKQRRYGSVHPALSAGSDLTLRPALPSAEIAGTVRSFMHGRSVLDRSRPCHRKNFRKVRGFLAGQDLAGIQRTTDAPTGRVTAG
jgi:hypothetical protein